MTDVQAEWSELWHIFRLAGQSIVQSIVEKQQFAATEIQTKAHINELPVARICNSKTKKGCQFGVSSTTQ